MGISNSKVSHDFYYRGVDLDKSGNYSDCSISYNGKEAKSYSTLVAKVIPTKGRKESEICTSLPESGIALFSYDSMTPTTGRHLGELRSASPFSVNISVPLNYGDRYLDPNILRENFRTRFESEMKHISRVEHRRTFIELRDSLIYLREHAAEEWAKPLRRAEFRKYLKVNLEEEAKKLLEKKRKDSAKKSAESKKIIKKYLEGRHGEDYLDILRAIYNPWSNEKYSFDSETRSLLKNKIGGNAWVWIDGENIKTSKGITLSIEDVKLALKAWSHGHDMRKFRVGPYSVVKYEGSIIQIGCHQIPRENVLALYEVLMGKPFEILPQMAG